MTRKEANTMMRNKYGANWFERGGVKEERNALMAGARKVRSPKRKKTSRGRPEVITTDRGKIRRESPFEPWVNEEGLEWDPEEGWG